MEKEKIDQIIKKVAAINDLSCLGGASLTEIIPVMAALGVETYPVPTLVLSTHTGGYEGYTYHDLTEHMKAQSKHWHELNVSFNAIYSGYLGSSKQISVVENFIDTFKNEHNLVLVDPVLGDEGQYYPSIDKNLVVDMRRLVSKADIITPNLTEAFFLAGIDYQARPSDSLIQEVIKRLKELGPRAIVITSVPASQGKIANLIIKDDLIAKVEGDYLGYHFPGTGDIFAAVLLGVYLNKPDLLTATKIASDFIYDAILFSKDKDYSHRSGVLLEAVLPKLFAHNPFFSKN